MSKQALKYPKPRPVVIGVLAADPCPWCGTQPELQQWHGGGPRKRLVGCANESCWVSPKVTGSTKARAIREWNWKDGYHHAR